MPLLPRATVPSRYRSDVLAVLLALLAGPTRAEESRFVDLSLLVAEGYPCTWAEGFPEYRLEPVARIGRTSDYNVDTLHIDGNTGTQLDVPAHSVARPELGLPHSSPFGTLFTDTVEPWKFGGEACVIDVADLLDSLPPGTSPLVEPGRVRDWERAHRPLGFGDAVLFRSGYADRYYRPLPEGRRFLSEPLERRAPAWPDPAPETMDALASQGVMHIGTDSPTMGPMPDLGEPVHFAAMKYGATFTEGAVGLGDLPATGAFYCILSPKHADGPYGEGRALAVVGGDLPARLIASIRGKRVIDLSVTMSPDLPLTWPGVGVGRHRQRYARVDFLWSDNLQLFHHGHVFDSHAGTHLVPPAYALPPEPLPAAALSPEARGWLEDYERDFGPRGTSAVTVEKVPLSQTCGPARVIDVRDLVGTVPRSAWPASPAISPDVIERDEAARGPIRPGDVVIFLTGHVDRTFRPRREAADCLANPLNGRGEGWPAVTPATIALLAERGVRCVGIDAPTIGGVDPRAALTAYWALGSRGMVAVEFLVNVAELPADAYFLFAPVKIEGGHGAPGRAIALH